MILYLDIGTKSISRFLSRFCANRKCQFRFTFSAINRPDRRKDSIVPEKIGKSADRPDFLSAYSRCANLMRAYF